VWCRWQRHSMRKHVMITQFNVPLQLPQQSPTVSLNTHLFKYFNLFDYLVTQAT
jgi:hypothetical protein